MLSGVYSSPAETRDPFALPLGTRFDAKGVAIDEEAAREKQRVDQAADRSMERRPVEPVSKEVRLGQTGGEKRPTREILANRLRGLQREIDNIRAQERVTSEGLRELQDGLSGRKPEVLSRQALDIRGHEMTLVRLSQERRGLERQVGEVENQLSNLEQQPITAVAA